MALLALSAPADQTLNDPENVPEYCPSPIPSIIWTEYTRAPSPYPGQTGTSNWIVLESLFRKPEVRLISQNPVTVPETWVKKED